MVTLKSALRRIRAHRVAELEPNWGAELLYERMFARALEQEGIKNDFYAVKGAANFSLLFLVYRAIADSGVRTVLEFGCGQTTILLDRLADRYDLTICSVEHDAGWLESVQSKVRHPIVHLRLEETSVAGRTVKGYRNDSNISGQHDLILVDGPFAATPETRYARLSTLPYIERNATEDSLILIDDYQRIGEQELAGRCMELRRQRHPDAFLATTQAAKWQAAVTSGRFTAFRYC